VEAGEIAMSRTSLLAAALVVSAFRFTGRASAQDVLLDIQSPVPGADADNGIVIGDWDGDGINDVAIGAIRDSTVQYLAGAVRVHSGKDGSVLAQFFGQRALEYFGAVLARTPDLDGDGVDDLAVTAVYADYAGPYTGSVFLYAGRTGAPLQRIDGPANGAAFGLSMGVVGDVDGDGIADLYMSDVALDEVVVHSGKDGHRIITYTGITAEYFGQSVSVLDDLDGDGIRDLLITAKHHQDAQGRFIGAAYVISTKTGSVLQTLLGTFDNEFFGYGSASIRDLDGDGVRDYAIASKDDVTFSKGPQIFVYSGASATQLAQLSSPINGGSFSTYFADAGDLDGDGFGDLAIDGAWSDTQGNGHGAVFLVSGRTFLHFERIEGEYGAFGAGCGDFDNDGRDDLIVGFSDYTTFDGEVRIYSGDDLWLLATPSEATAGDFVRLRTSPGVPGNPTALALEAVDGVPTFQLVNGVGTFGPMGGRNVDLTVPSGLAGHTFTLRAYAQNAALRVIQSATTDVVCK
jgi:hypothetical protein